MAANVYDIGTLVTMTGTFTTVPGGTLVDPTAAVCTLLDPTGVSTTPAVTRSSTGIYTATVTPAIAGKFTYRWTGTGAVAAAGELYFDVRHSVVLGI